jgi:hypothetical protein
MSADLTSADQICSTLSGRNTARQQQMFQQLRQIETIDADQSAALAEAAERSLAKQVLTLPELQTFYFLRRGTSPATEAVLIRTLGHHDPRAVIMALDASRFTSRQPHCPN